MAPEPPDRGTGRPRRAKAVEEVGEAARPGRPTSVSFSLVFDIFVAPLVNSAFVASPEAAVGMRQSRFLRGQGQRPFTGTGC